MWFRAGLVTAMLEGGGLEGVGGHGVHMNIPYNIDLGFSI